MESVYQSSYCEIHDYSYLQLLPFWLIVSLQTIKLRRDTTDDAGTWTHSGFVLLHAGGALGSRWQVLEKLKSVDSSKFMTWYIPQIRGAVLCHSLEISVDFSVPLSLYPLPVNLRIRRMNYFSFICPSVFKSHLHQRCFSHAIICQKWSL